MFVHYHYYLSYPFVFIGQMFVVVLIIKKINREICRFFAFRLSRNDNFVGFYDIYGHYFADLLKKTRKVAICEHPNYQ